MSYAHNSYAAYEKLDHVNQKQTSVFSAIDRLKNACNYDIAKELNWDINRVTPRVLELRDMDLVEEAYKDKNPVTNRTVSYWRIKHDPVSTDYNTNQLEMF